MEIDQFVGLSDKLGTFGLAAIAITALVRGWVIPGYLHKDLREDNKELRELNRELHSMIYRAAGITQEAVSTASFAVRRFDEEPNPITRLTPDERAEIEQYRERRRQERQ